MFEEILHTLEWDIATKTYYIPAPSSITILEH